MTISFALRLPPARGGVAVALQETCRRPTIALCAATAWFRVIRTRCAVAGRPHALRRRNVPRLADGLVDLRRRRRSREDRRRRGAACRGTPVASELLLRTRRTDAANGTDR